MIPEAILQSIQSNCGSNIVRTKPAGGGCISESYVITLGTGDRVFLKYNKDVEADFFPAEADGLRRLARTNVIKVPEVILVHDGKGDRPAFILLEYLETSNKTAKAEKALAVSLAKLHSINDKFFGLEMDNYCGLSRQKNERKESWADFFWSCRLLPQRDFAERCGWWNSTYERLFSSKSRIIKEMLFVKNEKPVLVHGDLWSGNVLWTNEGPALIDPAVYYGSREADLAFSEMFGGFSEEFYRTYNNLLPLPGGYHKRKSILNLYHRMNHANLFGGHYKNEVLATLKEM